MSVQLWSRHGACVLKKVFFFLLDTTLTLRIHIDVAEQVSSQLSFRIVAERARHYIYTGPVKRLNFVYRFALHVATERDYRIAGIHQFIDFFGRLPCNSSEY